MLKNITIILVVILVVSLLLGIVGAQLPSDLIVKQDAPTKIDLSNTAPSSAKAINDLNTKLSKQPRWVMPDIGYATSEPVNVVQGESETMTGAIKTFINGSEELPANVGYLNATANVTKIEELNGSLVFW
jgi:hypothetical protein